MGKKRKIEVIDKNGIKSYKVDGKHYDNFDNLPEDCKSILEDKNQNNIPDFIEDNNKPDDNHIFTNKVTKQKINVYHCQKRYNIDEMPPHLQEKIRKGELTNIKKEISDFENNNFNKSTGSTNQSHDYFQNNKSVRQYCDNCGNFLSDKSFLGYVKCEYCGKRMKKKKVF